MFYGFKVGTLLTPETRLTISQTLRWAGGFVGSLGLVGWVARTFDRTMFSPFGLAHGSIGLLWPICLAGMFLVCLSQRAPTLLAPAFIVVAVVMRGITGLLLAATACFWLGSARINRKPGTSEVL